MFGGDSAAGQTNGNGVAGKWFVATPDLAKELLKNNFRRCEEEWARGKISSEPTTAVEGANDEQVRSV